MGGSFQTSRDIFDNPIWKNIVDFRLFFLIYGQAVFAEEGVRLAEDLVLQRGEWCRSIRKIQEDLTYVENRQIKTYSTSVISRCIKRLEASQRICTRSHELGTVFTVLNYDQYQGFGGSQKQNLERNLEQSGNSRGTVEEQSGNNNKNVKNDNKENKEPKTNSRKRVYDESEVAYLSAKYLYDQINLHVKEIRKPNLQNWADDMRKLIESDGREPIHIARVIEWVVKDTFWSGNILSAKTLREKWDKLVIQMERGGSNAKYGRNARGHTEEDRQAALRDDDLANVIRPNFDKMSEVQRQRLEEYIHNT
ncbi:hypothetical protein OMP38_14565 [Cohnella ginsengisoli]|uniref:DnaD domain protein n=1 Tax=Cohnella ginsengisoli TaxID=425004 RepID=A0A9X4KLT4_9BACL|nr:hypothetical protein [Cohnella ginsengisoli]MDG0791940.1 hypothetical protein [Cohnella ginsengisoli]